MRLFSAWRSSVLVSELPDRTETRLAFQAGARYVLDELTECLEDFDAGGGAIGFDIVARTAQRLSDDIDDFTRVALLK